MGLWNIVYSWTLYTLLLVLGAFGQKIINLTPSPTATVIENNSLQLTCTYSRDGACPDRLQFEWKLNDAEKLVLGWTGADCILLRGDTNLEFSCSSAGGKCTSRLTLRQVKNSQHGDKWTFITDSKNATTSIYVNVPITGVQRTSPTVSQISVVENRPYNFSCLTTPAGRPDATVKWYRDPGSGPEVELTGANSVVEPSGTLSATRSTLSYTATNRDTGYDIYCKAYNIGPSTSHTGSQTTVTSVQYRPVISPIQNQDVIVSSPLTVQCTTTPGNPAQTSYRWTRSTDSTWSQTGQTLSLPSVTKGDAAVYTCTAWNVMTPTGGSAVNGTVMATFTANVLYAPVINPLQNRAVIASSPLSVQCTTTYGNPASTSYMWTRSTDSTWSQTGQTLSLLSVKKSDDAVYTCTAQNVMTPTGGLPVNGTDTKTFTLDVLYPPAINPLQNQDVVASSPLTVQCTTTPGNPAQTSYRWTRSTDSTWSQTDQTLRLPNVTKDDAAVYTCTAWNVMTPIGGSAVDGTDAETFTLNVLYAPVINPLNNRDVIASSPLSVQCTTTPGNPAQTSYRWTRNTDSTWSQTGQTLSLPHVTKGNADVYMCTATNVMTPTGGSPVDGTDRKTFTVNVLYPPVVSPLGNQNVTALSPLTVQCTTTPGNPKDTSYRWTRSTDSTWSQDGQTLRLPNVTKGDAAVYTCTAWNVMTPTGGPPVDGTDRKTFTVNVLYKASVTSFKLSEETDNSPPYTVNENDTRTFQCHVDSNPAAQITIQKQGGSQLVDDDNVYEVSLEKTLGCLDAGNYTCSGNNQYNVNGKSSMDLGLFVRCHPRLIGSAEQNITVYKARYEPVTLSVVVIAYPLPTFTWSVENNSSSDGWTPITANITSEGNRATMTIGKLELADFRQYKVEVKNKISPDYSQFWIIEPQGKPDVPINIRVETEGIKETSAVVQWTPGFNGGLDQTFIIQYTTGTDGADGQWTEVHGGVETTHNTIENLSPSTVYTVRVYANNTIGISDKSDSIQFTTLDKPSPPGSNIALIAGAAGGSVAALIVIAIVVILVIRKRKAPKRNSRRFSNGDDNDNFVPEIVENDQYVSAGPFQQKGSANGTGDDYTYSTVTKTQATALGSANPEQLYAMPDKKKGKGKDKPADVELYATPIKKTGKTADKEKKEKKAKKGKDKPKKGDIYENAQLNSQDKDLYSNANENLVYEDVGSNAAQQPQRNVNQDGLIYLDVVFQKDPNKKEEKKIHGMDDMTEYGVIDFTKKADPLPDSDEEDEKK